MENLNSNAGHILCTHAEMPGIDPMVDKESLGDKRCWKNTRSLEKIDEQFYRK